MTPWEVAWGDDHFQMNEHPSLRVETMVEACAVLDVTSGRRYFLQLHKLFLTLQIEPDSTKFGVFLPVFKIDDF